MSQYKLLLVDDTPNVLKALKRVFAEEDYKVYTAESANEASKILQQEVIDVLITDENMPGISGTDLLLTVKDTFPDLVKIMITGETDIEVAKRAINNGEIYKFFNKPWDDFELLLSVKYALKQKQLEKENKQLKTQVSRQALILEQLEKDFPGIAEKQVDADGCIVIEE